MATILIVEDRLLDRKVLTAVLRSGGHAIVEASDGREALDMLARMRPDLVISDILLPTVDGYEFVLRMREIPELAATPVIFYAAIYHEREARMLALQCGVLDVLTRPSPAQTILATVNRALSSIPPEATASLDRADSGREHLRLVGSTPATRIDRFDAQEERMKTVLEVAEQVVAQRDPLAILLTICTEARQVTLAQHAVAGLLPDKGLTEEILCTSGVDAETTVRLEAPGRRTGPLTAVLQERLPVRARNPGGRPETLGLPADLPPVSSLLSVPIASSSRVYGWLSLRNKLGADEFTDVDERAALTLGVHAGIAYENTRLFDDLHRRVTALEEVLHRRTIRVQDEARAHLSQSLRDQINRTLGNLKLDLQGLAAHLEPLAGGLRNDVTNRVDSILRDLVETIESVGRIAGELRPAVLDELGLIAALEWHAEQFERVSGIRCRVHSSVAQLDLDATRATAAFRIVQEALTNVAQHAHATRATVTLRKSDRTLIVSVADNGRGISDGDLARRGSLGLTGMRERSTRLRGHLDVRRRRPSGTVVRLTVPLAVA
jgi:signal transduction histidine kinase/FixJ family two-component response regulator